MFHSMNNFRMIVNESISISVSGKIGDSMIQSFTPESDFSLEWNEHWKPKLWIRRESRESPVLHVNTDNNEIYSKRKIRRLSKSWGFKSLYPQSKPFWLNNYFFPFFRRWLKIPYISRSLYSLTKDRSEQKCLYLIPSQVFGSYDTHRNPHITHRNQSTHIYGQGISIMEPFLVHSYTYQRKSDFVVWRYQKFQELSQIGILF